MRYLDSVRRAGRGLKNAKARTILTSLAISVGAFTITLALAAGAGARSFVDDLISSNIDPHSIYVSMRYEGSNGAKGSEIQEYKTGDTAKTSSDNDPTQYMMSKQTIDKIAALSEIKTVTPMYNITLNYVQHQSDQAKYVVLATTYNPGIVLDKVGGSLPTMGTDIASGDVVISEKLAKKLAGNDNAPSVVGSSLTLNVLSAQAEARDFSYRIVAVTKPAAMSFNEGNDVTLSAAASQEVSEYTTKGTPLYQQYYGALAVAKDGTDPEAAKKAIHTVNDKLDVQTAKEFSSQIFQVVNVLQYGVMGFGVIALIAAVFGVINTQYISVLERTREIGLMKALGMRGRYVRRLFQLEAAWIGFLGGILGAVFAIVIGLLVNPWLAKVLALPAGKYLLIFEPLSIVLLVFALTLVAMLAGWYPSWKASRLDPVDALRSE